MTSRISFSKLVKDEWKKLGWLMAVQLLGFLMLIPFRVLLILASCANDIEKWNWNIELAQMFYQNFGLGLPENTLAVLAAGIVVAICTFSYLFSAEKLDFLHSLPVKRIQLLAVKVAGSTLTFVIAWLTALVMGLLVGAMYGVCSETVVKETVVVFIRGILQFLCSYAAALTGIMLTGKLLTAVLACFSLGVYVPMLVYMSIILRQVFLSTSFDYNWDTSRWLPYTSPWSFCLSADQEEIRKGLTGYFPSFVGLCQILALTAVLFLIAVLLYRIRQTEAAGKALAFHQTEGTVKILISVPIAVLSAILAHEMFEQILWELGFLVLFGVLACMIMELIYRWDIRLILKKKHHMAVTVLLATAILLGTRYVSIGYNTYLPEKEEVQAMAIKDNYQSYIYPLEYADTYERYSVTRELMDYLETERVDLIYELAESAVKTGEPVSVESQEDLCQIYIKYHLKNGKEVYRRYHADREKYMNVMDELMKDELFRMKYYPILGWEERPEGYQGMYLSSPREYLTQFTEEGSAVRKTWEMTEEELDKYWEEQTDVAVETYHVDLTVPEDEIQRILETYQEELQEASYTEVAEAKGWLNFYFECREKAGYTYTSVDSYPIPYTFEETLSLLAEIWEEESE